MTAKENPAEVLDNNGLTIENEQIIEEVEKQAEDEDVPGPKRRKRDEEQLPETETPAQPQRAARPLKFFQERREQQELERRNAQANIDWSDRTQVEDTDQIATPILHITNLTRPFNNAVFKSLLSNEGEIQEFWIDSIKTHCYVQFAFVDAAAKAKQTFNGVRFPLRTGKFLHVEFADEESFKATVHQNSNPVPVELPVSEEKVEKAVVSVDELFRKTITKPQIYYSQNPPTVVQEQKEYAMNKIKQRVGLERLR
eukprot:TRINITY_DN3669_c0_g1_i1.p2 TRINITY_DN3669_c0_g1~~TRINITY_DN3669_c0_g1_i1.p2  ORF type:complete len:255 (-),score=57.78 TRINITY_DN3669_c0_g1_i1:41-805(-)